MQRSFATETKEAFIDTGALVAGAFLGGGLTLWLLEPGSWWPDKLGAIIGAGLASGAVRSVRTRLAKT